MKKLFSSLLIISLLCGCSSSSHQETNDRVTITNKVEVTTKTLDMSGYAFLSDSNPAFEQITMEESLKLYDEGGTAIIYYGYADCAYCNRAVPVLNEALKEMGVKAYYVDVYGDELMADDTYRVNTVNALFKRLDTILKKERNSETGELEPAFYTPEVVAVKNGKIVDHHVALVSSAKITTATSQLTDDQKSELKEIYIKLIKEIAD